MYNLGFTGANAYAVMIHPPTGAIVTMVAHGPVLSVLTDGPQGREAAYGSTTCVCSAVQGLANTTLSEVNPGWVLVTSFTDTSVYDHLLRRMDCPHCSGRCGCATHETFALTIVDADAMTFAAPAIPDTVAEMFR